MNLPELYSAAREIFNEALKSVDAAEAVRRAVQIEDGHLKILETTFSPRDLSAGLYSIAIGKAAHPMASALSEILEERLKACVIAAPPPIADFALRNADWKTTNFIPQIRNPRSAFCNVFHGGHPLPNRESLEAARAAFDLLRRADRMRALIIFLISGGGSAMMEWPRDESITLEELRETNRVLVSCGASIAEVNSVRRAISAVKGGKLARHAAHCNQVSLIVSDTGAGEEDCVASGPTFKPPMNAPDPASVITRYSLESKLPVSILRAIKLPVEKEASGSNNALRREHYVLLENSTALESAAEAARIRGFTVEIARDIVGQQIDEGCSLLLSRLYDLRRRTDKGRGVCLISGGEFACPVRGSGIGGRNAESVLRWAIELYERADKKSHIVALSAGTDGIDGNSPAAGAIADEKSAERARLLNMDARRFLDESDAYTFFQQLNDAIITGPTGTNVRDLRIMLAS